MNAQKLKSALLVFALSAGSLLYAQEIHKWTDEEGNVHYGSVPPVKARADVVEVDQQNFSTPEDALETNTEQSNVLSKEEVKKAKREDNLRHHTANIARLKEENLDPVKCAEQKEIMTSLAANPLVLFPESIPAYQYHKTLASFYCGGQ